MITDIESILKTKQELSDDLVVLLDNFTKTTGWEINNLNFDKQWDGKKEKYIIDIVIKYKNLIIDKK
jgi:hypothetical protein